MEKSETFNVKNHYDNLIKNFYLFGVEPGDIDISNFENNYLKQNFLQIKLLSKFPPNETKILIDPNIIISHCFPNGYYLRQTMHDLENEYEFFHFNLRNLLSTSYYEKRIYFTCCIFYENLTKYLSLQNLQRSTLNLNNKKINNDELLSNRTIKPEQIYIPKLMCISSFIPFPIQYRTILEKLILYSKKKEIKIPIEKEIENLVLGIPFPKRGIFYPTKRSDYCIDVNIDFLLRDLNQCNFSSYKLKRIFVFKIDDVIRIYKYILLEKPILFFSDDKEKLTNIFESFLSLIFPFEYQNPHCSILPECNSGIIEQAKSFLFGINEKWVESGEEKKNYFHRLHLNVFKTVLICDIDREKVFTYQRYNIDAILTFDELLSNKYPNLNPIILTTAKENNLSNPNKEQIKMPNKYSEKLKKKLKDQLLNNKNDYSGYSEKSNEIITEYFYYFLVSILKNYNDYLYNSKEEIININNLFLKKDLKQIKIEELFKANQFIKGEVDKNDDPLFFEILLQTNLFKNFLFRKYRNSEFDKYNFLLFDETIITKKNKNKFSKIKTEFLNSKSFSTTVNYIVEKTQDFKKYEYEEINSKKSELINYYQKYDGKNFSYYLFPKLLFDNQFFKNKIVKWTYLFNKEKLDQIYIGYENNKKKIDSHFYFKIYDGDLIKRYNFDRKDYIFKNEMNNIIGYLWMSVFSFTFYYCNDIDKKFRFQEMMKYLRNLEIPFTHKKIINFIYLTLTQYGNDYMIINFYDYLNSNDYDLYNHFCNRMLLNDNILKNKEKLNNLILKKLDVGNKLSLYYYKDKDEDINNIKYNSLKLSLTICNNKDYIDKKNILPKRSFYPHKTISYKDVNITDKEAIVFSSTIKCTNCNKEIDIYRLAAEICNMSKQAELTCSYCNKSYIPENLLSVGHYGRNIKVYNPYYLYHVITIHLMKKYGTKIDLDILREEYPDFYWNCILYFSLAGYSYDMMIKYKNPENENKEYINNPYDTNKIKGFYNLKIQRQNIDFL